MDNTSGLEEKFVTLIQSKEFWQEIIVFVLMLLAIVLFAIWVNHLLNKPTRKKAKGSDTTLLNGTESIDIGDEDRDYGDRVKPLYLMRPLLTQHERENYDKLKPITDWLGLEVFVKVRLLNLLQPNEDRTDVEKCFQMMKDKCIDFVIWNPINKKVVLLIEIEDNYPLTKARYKQIDFIRRMTERADYVFKYYKEIKPDIMKYKLEGLLRGR